jgi:ElaA protein
MGLSKTFCTKHFNDLTPTELYEILKLRHNVFVIEQNCIYPELDDYDKECFHVFLIDDEGKCIATSRIVPPKIKHGNFASIGRVCCAINVRKTTIGKQLMNYSIQKLEELYPSKSIKIGAQLYLKNFYESFGFIQVSEPYDEDGILHIDMIK